MADDDLKEPVSAKITDANTITTSSTPHKGKMKWVTSTWEDLFTEMENLSDEFKPTLLAPTSAVDKQRNHATQFPDQKVRNSKTLQQLVLVNLSKAKELCYLSSTVLNRPDEEWRYCIEHREREVSQFYDCILTVQDIQKKIFQSEDFYICNHVPSGQSLTMVRFALTSLKLESQARTMKEDKRSPQKIIRMFKLFFCIDIIIRTP